MEPGDEREQELSEWELWELEQDLAAGSPHNTNTIGDDMPRTGEMIESKYLRKEDFDEDGTIVTIARFEQVNVAMEDAKPDFKWAMYFREYEKGLIMNSTNIQLAEAAFGSDNTDDWEGKKIILYVDPNVSYQKKLIGGLRLKANRVSGGPKAAPEKVKNVDKLDEDPPWTDEEIAKHAARP